MRGLFGLICVLALGAMALVGCETTGGGGGSAGSGGVGGDGGQGGVGGGTVACVDNLCPCTEAGIRAAIAEGGGPFTFDCDVPTTVETEAEIVIDNDVILDGEDNLTVDGHESHRVFSVPEGVKAELNRLATKGGAVGFANEGTLTLQDCVVAEHRSEFLFGCGAGISNEGEMTIIDSTVTGNYAGHGTGGGICNHRNATLLLVDSTVSDNGADGDGPGLYGGGISNQGEMTIINSTVSGNDAYDAVVGEGLGGGIANTGWMSVTNGTVSGNSADSGDAIAIGQSSYTEIASTLIDGDCDSTGDGSTLTRVSLGYNIESPGNTCGFDQTGDQVNVSADDLNLGPLQNNGGPTETHALLPGSPAINQIPQADCIDADGAPLATDQRGEPRPDTGGTTCDVGAFERQPTDP